jgi:MFS family permease
MPFLTALIPPRAYRWNFTVMGLDFSIFLLGLSFASAYGVMPLFVHHLTASNLALGLITTVRAVGTSLPPILVAPRTERLRRKKPFLLIMTTFERLPYLVLAVATPLLAGSHPALLLWLFFAMVGIGTWFGGVGLPAWLDLLARMLPADWRGRFFGFAAALGGLLGVLGAGIAAIVLERFAWPNNFAVCFACTTACLAVSFIFIALGREPAPAGEMALKDRAEGGYWRRLPALVRADSNFARYLAATVLISAAGMAASFYTIDAKRTLHLSDAAAGIYAVVLLAASTLGNVAWGYLGDRIGHKRVVEGGALCTGIAALVALLVRQSGLGLAGYGLVFVLVGLASSGIQLASLTFIIDFAPVAQRPTYVGLANLAAVPFTAGAPLLGGIIADRAGYPVVFALTLVLALAGTLIVWRHVVDPRTAVASESSSGCPAKSAGRASP